MKIIVCVKEVPDPETTNAFAVSGQLQVGPEGNTLSNDAIPLVMNEFDERAIEVALRLRDAGQECEIIMLSIAPRRQKPLFARAFALGVDKGYVLKDPVFANATPAGIASALAAAIQRLGGADLILCGRQAADDDQSVVGPSLAAALDIPCVTFARGVEPMGDGKVRVARALPDRQQDVSVLLPAVVTVSSEVGAVRDPGLRNVLQAKGKSPSELTLQAVGLDTAGLEQEMGLVKRVSLSLPQVEGNCRFITGDDPRQIARELLASLKAEGLLQ